MTINDAPINAINAEVTYRSDCWFKVTNIDANKHANVDYNCKLSVCTDSFRCMTQERSHFMHLYINANTRVFTHL